MLRGILVSSFTAFSGNDAIKASLVVRRVRPTPGSQLALLRARTATPS
jgi:hypothetical protein